jgi:hypothetical protein
VDLKLKVKPAMENQRRHVYLKPLGAVTVYRLSEMLYRVYKSVKTEDES